MNWKDAWICVDEMDYFLFSVGLVFFVCFLGDMLGFGISVKVGFFWATSRV